MKEVTCVFCRKPAKIRSEEELLLGPPFFHPLECKRCGVYYYPHASTGLSGVDDFPAFREAELVRLSGWVNQQNAAGVFPKCKEDVVRRVRAMPLPRYRERANLALSVIAKKYPAFIASPTKYSEAEGDEALQGKSFSSSRDEVRQLLRILESEQLIESLNSPPTDFRLTAHGLLTVDDKAATGSVLAQGFVAMSFSEAMKDPWTNGFDPAIRAAGFRPFKINDKDYIGGITDEIMKEIRCSKFIVADYTEQRNGVYFEAGFAVGLGLTVIPTCRNDELKSGKLHFDIKHLNTLGWDTPEDLEHYPIIMHRSRMRRSSSCIHRA